jgi:hypothetical protein
LSGDHSIEIRPGGLVGVKNLQIFIPQSIAKSKQIEIDQMILYGTPLALTGYNEMELQNFTAVQQQGARDQPGPSTRDNKHQQQKAAVKGGQSEKAKKLPLKQTKTKTKK